MAAKGAFEITLEHKTLWVKASGVWTIKTAKDYVATFQQTITPIIDRPWAAVFDFAEWKMSPADVFTLLRENTEWAIKHNIHCVLAIDVEDKLLIWQFLKVTNVTRPDYLQTGFIASVAQARETLRAGGYIID